MQDWQQLGLEQYWKKSERFISRQWSVDSWEQYLHDFDGKALVNSGRRKIVVAMDGGLYEHWALYQVQELHASCCSWIIRWTIWKNRQSYQKMGQALEQLSLPHLIQSLWPYNYTQIFKFPSKVANLHNSKVSQYAGSWCKLSCHCSYKLNLEKH